MALTTTLISNITCGEIVSTTDSPAASGTQIVNHDGYNDSEAYSATTTPDVEQVINESRTLTGTSETFDLTAAKLARDVGQSIDLTGKKLIAFKIRAATGNNAAGLVVKQGAANPYFVWGATGDQVTLLPGDNVLKNFKLGTATPAAAVSATVKNILITGTIGDQVDVLMVFG